MPKTRTPVNSGNETAGSPVETPVLDGGAVEAASAGGRLTGRVHIWLPLAIALCFTAWSFRSSGPYNMVETDAARHAMNGVFIHDLVAAGKILDVFAFAKSYYAHLPALSLPYHPPCSGSSWRRMARWPWRPCPRSRS
jgi:hypothetical protein